MSEGMRVTSWAADGARWLGLVLFNVRNQFRNWMFFLPSWFLNLLQMFLSAAVFFLMGEYVGPQMGQRIGGAAGSYGSYIVLGLLFSRTLEGTLSSFHNGFLSGYWATQFDTYMAHPGGVSAYMAGHLLSHYLNAAINATVSLIVAVALFRVTVAVDHLPAVIVVMAAGVFSLLGCALLGASTFTLLGSKQWQSNPVAWLMSLAVVLLGGVYFPVSVLPPALERAAEWVPQMRAIRAARLCLGGAGGLADAGVAADLRYLLWFGLASLPVGIAAFAVGMRKAQREGSLSRWS